MFEDLSSEEAIAAGVFRSARQMFLRDGGHTTVFFLFRNQRPIGIVGARPEDQAEKYLIMRDVAHRVALNGADAVISIGETWSAPFDAANPYRRPHQAPDRQEHLVLTLVTKDGEPTRMVAKIERPDRQPTLGPTIIERGGAAFFLAPVYQAWGRPVPQEWEDAMRQAETEDTTPKSP